MGINFISSCVINSHVLVPWVLRYPWVRQPSSVHMALSHMFCSTESFNRSLYFVMDFPVTGWITALQEGCTFWLVKRLRGVNITLYGVGVAIAWRAYWEMMFGLCKQTQRLGEELSVRVEMGVFDLVFCWWTALMLFRFVGAVGLDSVTLGDGALTLPGILFTLGGCFY